MTIFEPVLTEIDGHRAAELRFRANQADSRPRRVLLVEEVRLASLVRPPFMWRFAHESTELRDPRAIVTGQGAPVVMVIAGPGISVRFDGFPDTYIPQPGLPLVNVYRVQDPAVLPRLASDTPSAHLLGTYEVSNRPFIAALPGSGPADPPVRIQWPPDPERHFTVEQLPSNVVITHIGSGDQWTITVPAFSTDPRTAQDALARFAFQIDVDQTGTAAMLKIVKTRAARLSVTDRHVHFEIFGKDLNPGPLRIAYWQIWEVDLITQVPPQGAPIEPGPGWRLVETVRRVRNPAEEALVLEQTIVDVVVGLIPVVGDAVDVAEFLYGAALGKDKWGNPLSKLDLALLGIAALVPFVGGGVVKAGRRLVQRFAEHSDEAVELAERLRRAGLKAEDVALLRQVEETIKAGRAVPAEFWHKALAVMRRVPGAEPTIDSLLNAERTGFAHAELQEAYQRYLANQGRRGRTAQGPSEWARSVTSGRPRQLFESLLGNDYAKRLVGVDAPPLNLLDIPRPAGYADDLLAAHRELARRSDRLWERLGKLEAEPADPGATSIGVLRRQVTAGRFRILKGNVAEIFAGPIQRAELARIAKAEKGAVLVSGVKVRLMKDGKLGAEKLFSDNVILVKRGSQVRVLAVFEVKSGFKGGQEATEQIFEWIEGRLTDGSQLVIPQGSTFTSAAGRTWTSSREIGYTWKPAKEGIPTITGLASAGERHLITAKGTSALGVDSASGVAANVTRHELPQTSAELDYLCADLLLGRSAAPVLSLPAAQ